MIWQYSQQKILASKNGKRNSEHYTNKTDPTDNIKQDNKQWYIQIFQEITYIFTSMSNLSLAAGMCI